MSPSLSALTTNYIRSFGNNDQNDFRIVSGILRLSTKYIVDSLRAKALAHLSTAWPSSLRAWDLREDLARGYELESATPGAHLYPHPFVSTLTDLNTSFHADMNLAHNQPCQGS